MKCVKMVEDKAIRRVTEEEAARLVAAGKATYTTKGAWKAAKKGGV